MEIAFHSYRFLRLSERQGELDSSFGTQPSLQSELTETEATLRAQLSLMERELGEVRGAKEQLSQAQFANRELERTNLKMTTQQNTARKENMRLKEVIRKQMFVYDVCCYCCCCCCLGGRAAESES